MPKTPIPILYKIQAAKEKNEKELSFGKKESFYNEDPALNR